MGNLALIQKKVLNKTLLFDTKKIDEEIIMDRIIQALPADNDEFYIEHSIAQIHSP